MLESQVVAVAWQPDLHIDVGYDDGQLERWVGNRVMAARIANEAGLALAPAPRGTARWGQGPRRLSA